MRRGKFVWKDKAKTGVVFMEDPKGKCLIEGPKEDVFGNKTKAKRKKKFRDYPRKAHPAKFDKSSGIIKLHPLSVNEAWSGKRFKSVSYMKYSDAVTLSLKTIKIPASPYEISFLFGFHNMQSDYDNGIKSFQDLVFKKYKISDAHIHMGTSMKVKVLTTEDEFVAFRLDTLTEERKQEYIKKFPTL